LIILNYITFDYIEQIKQMIKFNDANQMIQKKIARNNIMCEIFELSKIITDIQIQIKEHTKFSYENKIKTIKTINKIEHLQCSEYTIKRQEKIAELIESISYQLDSSELLKKITELKETIKEKTILMNQYQELIPQKGTVLNYTIKFNPNPKSCSSSVNN
jgi:hypothetical protein